MVDVKKRGAERAGVKRVAGRKADVAGITALVPPEIVYAAGWRPLDVNNGIPGSGARPRSKLCAWTASWRQAILEGRIKLDALVVVAGGDCHNALADGQVASRNVKRTHYFFYPFDGDVGYLREQLDKLGMFLSENRKGKARLPDPKKVMSDIAGVKELGLKLDTARTEGDADPEQTFKALISFSDLEGDIVRFRRKIEGLLKAASDKDGTPDAPERPRVALIGVPPIYRDFHQVCAESGLQVVFDELPYEFLRLGGRDTGAQARSYSNYTFARPADFRLDFLKRELNRRKVDGVIHYAQFTCHHLLEDGLLREELDWPMLTVQGDLPGETPAQVRLRLEAFGELLSRR